MKNRRNQIILAVILMCIVLFLAFAFSDDKDLQKEVVQQATEMAQDIATYEMTEEEIESLPSTEIVEQTEEQENAQEQEVENEDFELQGEIAYEGDRAISWDVELGDYKGLTYYSQIDSRWKDKMYSSVGNSSQTIGTSGCGPTCASMVVTACKGTITPDAMADLFVKYGYRSANNGTYWSAFRAVADEFNIGYTETTDIQRALQLLQSNNYVVVSCGNGLFTTGGHFIVLTELNGDTITVYDPYLYSGKFDTSTRRGKATVDGNKVYVTVENFINYANAKGFFCYAHDENVQENKQTVTTSAYTRYVNAKIGLNVRNTANGSIVGALANGTKVTVYETNGSWSRIGTNRWVSSNYLSSYSQVGNAVVSNNTRYRAGTYKVNASVLNVRPTASTKYTPKNWRQLSANARQQNAKLGKPYCNGYAKGVVCTVTKVSGNWGLTASGWICLDFCSKI